MSGLLSSLLSCMGELFTHVDRRFSRHLQNNRLGSTIVSLPT